MSDWPKCPHCQQPTETSHFMSETSALLVGRTLCTRIKRWIAQMDYWGFACPDGHVCYACIVPRPPQPGVE